MPIWLSIRTTASRNPSGDHEGCVASTGILVVTLPSILTIWTLRPSSYASRVPSGDQRRFWAPGAAARNACPVPSALMEKMPSPCPPPARTKTTLPRRLDAVAATAGPAVLSSATLMLVDVVEGTTGTDVV